MTPESLRPTIDRVNVRHQAKTSDVRKLVPPARLELARLAAEDFESSASTIPPEGHGLGS